MPTSHSNSHNLIIAFVSGVPGLFYAAVEQTPESIMRALILPIVLFLVGKGIDIAVKFYFEKKRSKKED